MDTFSVSYIGKDTIFWLWTKFFENGRKMGKILKKITFFEKMAKKWDFCQKSMFEKLT